MRFLPRKNEKSNNFITLKLRREKRAQRNSLVDNFQSPLLPAGTLNDDKFTTKQNLSAAIPDEIFFLLFYALLCAMVEIYEINDSIMQISTEWVLKVNAI